MKFYNAIRGTVYGALKIFMFLKVRGNKNIPKEGAFLLCANHRSNMDAVLLAASCNRQLTFMAKEELFKVAFLGRLIKALGAFPIKRGRGDAAAVMATLKIMKKGGVTVVFPEGTRMKNGERKQVSSGIIRLAMQSNVPILPAFVSKNSVTYGEAISYQEYAEDMQNAQKMQSLADSLMDTIYSLETEK